MPLFERYIPRRKRNEQKDEYSYKEKIEIIMKYLRDSSLDMTSYKSNMYVDDVIKISVSSHLVAKSSVSHFVVYDKTTNREVFSTYYPNYSDSDYYIHDERIRKHIDEYVFPKAYAIHKYFLYEEKQKKEAEDIFGVIRKYQDDYVNCFVDECEAYNGGYITDKKVYLHDGRLVYDANEDAYGHLTVKIYKKGDWVEHLKEISNEIIRSNNSTYSNSKITNPYEKRINKIMETYGDIDDEVSITRVRK